MTSEVVLMIVIFICDRLEWIGEEHEHDYDQEREKDRRKFRLSSPKYLRSVRLTIYLESSAASAAGRSATPWRR